MRPKAYQVPVAKAISFFAKWTISTFFENGFCQSDVIYTVAINRGHHFAIHVTSHGVVDAGLRSECKLKCGVRHQFFRLYKGNLRFSIGDGSAKIKH